MDATWPDDIWKITFDVQEDGSVKVSYDIIMAVPDHEDRPTDYLNFGEKEHDFIAFDYETGEELKIEINQRDRGQTVTVYPYRELHRGDRYRYSLKFTVQEGFVRRLTEHCFIVEWGWGNWPLEYTVKFIVPPKVSVYYATDNLHEKGYQDNRPFLVFKDRSEHNTSIHIYFLYHRSEKEAIRLVTDGMEKGIELPTFKAQYTVMRDLNIEVRTRISVPSEESKIDIPIAFLTNRFSHLSITDATTGKNLRYMSLPMVIRERVAFLWMRVDLSEGEIDEASREIVVKCRIDARAGVISRIGQIFRLLLDVGGIDAKWKVSFELPDRMAVFFAMPKPSNKRIKADRPIITFDANTEALGVVKTELLFKASSESKIELGYRFIQADMPNVVEVDQPFSVPFTITNTLPDACDFTVQAELNGFQESSITRKLIALAPGESKDASIMLMPKEAQTKGNLQFWVHAEGQQTEITENYEILIRTKLVKIRRCFKIGVRSCPRLDLRNKPNTVFIGMPYRDAYEDHYRFGILPILDEFGLKVLKADEEIANIDIMCKVCGQIQETEYAIINLSSWNPNVLLELGILYGLGKHVLLIKYAEDRELAVDLEGMQRCEYSNIEELKDSLRRYFGRMKNGKGK